MDKKAIKQAIADAKKEEEALKYRVQQALRPSRADAEEESRRIQEKLLQRQAEVAEKIRRGEKLSKREQRGELLSRNEREHLRWARKREETNGFRDESVMDVSVSTHAQALDNTLKKLRQLTSDK